MEKKLQQVLSMKSMQTAFLKPIYNYISSKASLLDLKAQNFKVKEGYTSAWTPEEEKAVSKFMKGILQNPESLNYYDYFTYVSRKILDGSKSRSEVKKYLTQFLKNIED